MLKNKIAFLAALVLAACLFASPLGARGEEAQTEAPLFLQNFTANDIDGNDVDQSLFEDYDLTMINIWGTYCGPCLNELPDLGKLHAEYAQKGVQVVGIVADVLNADGSLSESQIELAKEIVQQTGAAYVHLVPSEDLNEILLWQIYALPTTVFVNNKGELTGYSYMGSADYDTWAQRIEETLSVLE